MVECLPSKQKTWVRFPQLVSYDLSYIKRRLYVIKHKKKQKESFPGEMVDTLDLKSDAARRNGSSPLGSSFILIDYLL